MENTDLPIPATPKDFHAALGAEILAALEQPDFPAILLRICIVADSQKPVNANPQVATGRLWCLYNSDPMVALGDIAAQAITLGEGRAKTALKALTDGIDDSQAIKALLANCQPLYLQRVILTCARQRNYDSCAALLNVLRQIGEQLKQIREEAIRKVLDQA